MRYGFYLPTRGRSAEPDALEALVERGEALGFHSTVIADHVVFPVAIASKYPYTVSGAFPGGGDGAGAAHAHVVRRGQEHAAAPDHERDDPAAPQPRAHRQDAGDDRRAVEGPCHGRGWSRLAAGGVRRPWRRRLRPPRRRQRRVSARLQDAVDAGPGVVQRRVLPVRGSQVPAPTGAEAAPADLGRWP